MWRHGIVVILADNSVLHIFFQAVTLVERWLMREEAQGMFHKDTVESDSNLGMKKLKTRRASWGDFAVCKMCAMQGRAHLFDPQDQHKRARYGALHLLPSLGRQRHAWVCRAHWLASLAH